METLLRKSSLGIKLELFALAGTLDSTGTAVTGTTTSFLTELEVGDIIGLTANGWRRVLSIADDTNLVVEAAFDVDLSGDTVNKHNYGVDPTLAAANIIEFLDDSVMPTYGPEMQERNVVRNTVSKLTSVRGAELNAEGTINTELHGSGTAGVAPESDPLWECAIGVKNLSVASAIDGAASTTTVLDITTGTGDENFSVGDSVLVNGEVAWITLITDGDAGVDQLTVTPALSAAPGDTDVVGAGTHYKLSKTELKSFFGSFWRGDVDRCDFDGSKIATLGISFTTGEIIKPSFGFQSRKTFVPVSEAYALGDPSYDPTDPLVALLMLVNVGGSLYHVSDVGIEINNGIYKRTSVTTSGIQAAIRTDRVVTGSFSLLYENKDVEVAFRNDDRNELIIIAGDTAGNIFAIRLPRIRYTETPITVDAGLFKYDISWEAELTDALGEDEITSCSFL